MAHQVKGGRNIRRPEKPSDRFLIKVSADGTVKGDYWANLERFEFEKTKERAEKALDSLSRINEMLAKLDLVKKQGYAKKSVTARIVDKRKKKSA